MKTMNCATSACQLCRYYQPEGRRGGMCKQLGVPVKANWKACSLALPPFAPSWESLEVIWQQETVVRKEPVTVAIPCSLDYIEQDFPIKKHLSVVEEPEAKIMLV